MQRFGESNRRRDPLADGKLKLVGGFQTKWCKSDLKILFFNASFKLDDPFDGFKAKLVAERFMQRLGTDSEDTIAPSFQMATLIAYLAICTVENLQITHLDIKNAVTEAPPEAFPLSLSIWRSWF